MKIIPYPLKRSQWFTAKTAKQYVVWHGTGGRTIQTPAGGRPGLATTSIDAWNANAAHVGAPWLVNRDGTIYRTFDDSGWIFHLGIPGTHATYDKSSVAIELANELDLTLDGDRLYAFGEITFATEYRGPYVTTEWRGATHFAALDEAQIDAAIELTLDVCRRNSIDPKFYCPATTYDFPRCFEVATIVCHSNCRADKKDLLLPDWVYQKLEAAGVGLVS